MSGGLYRKKIRKEVISFLGPPGSGKGTVVQQWVESGQKVESLSTGALCREHVRYGGKLGDEVSKHISQGRLIPDELISAMVRSWLSKRRGSWDVLLLDGYPRTAQQAKDLVEIIADEMPEYRLRVVLFVLTSDAVVDRLGRRVVCSNCSCQRVYSTVEVAEEKVCKVCQKGDLVLRDDDNIDVIKKRLAIYELNKKELLEQYKKLKIVINEFDVERVPLNNMFQTFYQLIVR